MRARVSRVCPAPPGVFLLGLFSPGVFLPISFCTCTLPKAMTIARGLGLLRLPATRRWCATVAAAGGYAALTEAQQPYSICEAHARIVPAAPAEATSPSLTSRCIAEAIGTAIIVCGGCGSVAAAKYGGSGANVFAHAITWGISVTLAVYATRAVSGAHLNPAVTAALVATGKSPADEAPAYIAAQCLGAFAAGVVTYAVWGNAIAATEAAAGIVRGTAASAAIFAGAFGMIPNTAVLGAAGALVAEIWMTGLLMFMICAIGDSASGSVPAGSEPALVGATVAMIIGTYGPVNGAGMNPARDLGPRLVTLLTGWGPAALTGWWIYTVGPVIGAVLGAMAYDELIAPQTAMKAQKKVL